MRRFIFTPYLISHMKQFLLLLIIPFWTFAQEPSFSTLDSPILFLGQTGTGVKLEYRKDGNDTYYKMSFPVSQSQPHLGNNAIEFPATDAELESFRVYMIKSMSGVFDRTDYSIGNYTIEMFTNRKNVHGKEKQIGKTQVTVLSVDRGQATDKIKYDGKIQEGHFTITKTEVNKLFGKAMF